ncbi:glycosyltransferase family 4 protein [Flavobacterium sinopsychrotolerans]|uniref:Glycosyltransferase involved in cell wall bisynthesis n=1 Tax=Flavobacterium sinopsychrotolerans TaxID=604089 RepID=A0A1H8RAN6_9FLAO|nr:glycosyltransferase family 4 protein [Flavobacterium sinopsychrotolerans]SEO63228.1 Glycosyltransferase involved in cell wall bisynthesis [Flavobacterium sinopsychrotolerans]
MKIAFIIPKLINEAPVIVVRDLINQINDKVVSIDIYYFDDVDVKEINVANNCYKISFLEGIDFDNYDIIHSHMLRPDLYILFNRHKIKKAKCVSTLHNDIFKVLKDSHNIFVAFIVEKLWIKALNSFDSVVVLSESMKSQYIKSITKVPLSVVFNGRDFPNSFESEIEDADVKSINLLKSQYKLIGVSARIRKIKGFSQLIKVLPFLNEYALIFVGDGDEKQTLIELAKELNVLDRCLFLGYRIDGFRYLKFFDFYAMTSYSEGFPLGLLEAAQNKLPVFCSDLPVFRELFDESEVSYYHLNDIESLKYSILKLENNKEEFSKNLWTTVMNKYSLKKMGKNYLDLYKKLIY